ncbi:DUF6928 family protein [Corynebacterium poyangense]|uniref:DUF6928 family protein n=1 Tax=Corynebacterium poyangense TaxID=2684405 RepID=UPI0037BEFB4A
MTFPGMSNLSDKSKEYHQPVNTTVTLWFLSTADPSAVLEKEPQADRGFGRKYLAQLNPSWPVTSIGQFPLNRSVPASSGEFYIAGYGRVSVIQTFLENCSHLSDIDPRLLNSLPADTVIAVARGGTGRWEEFGGFARWEQGELKRSLCATREELFEDVGLPYPFESPFWAGERAEQLGGISLPFNPQDLVAEAETQWLGVPITPEGPDIPVAAFAVDGRPAPRVDGSAHRILPKPGQGDASTSAGDSAEKQYLPAAYDDYEEHRRQLTTGDDIARIAEASAVVARRLGKSTVRGVRTVVHRLQEKLRHIDRS